MQPRIALSKDFMAAYADVPKGIQRKVRAFTEKFQEDPTQSTLNFERINGAIDPKVRSVRIDQAYRAIVIHPPKGDVYVCVWVDHHDAAYAWVKNRRFEVNPVSGTFQIFQLADMGEVASAPQSAAAPVDTAGPPTLFSSFGDEDLLLAGVPEPLLPAIRALAGEAELDAVAPHLPADSAEVLYMLAAGYELFDAIEEVERGAKPTVVDTEDFATALARPESQQTFKLLDSEEELQAMLDAPLQQWRVFLHPTQRKLVTMTANGPVRVLGGAGTGKTVVLMHRAKHLIERVFPAETDRILVTTYTRNLALDLEANLRNLCAPDSLKRLEVSNLHRWALTFMRKQGHAFRLVSSESQRRDLFEQAMLDAPDERFALNFYLDEWDHVVQSQEVTSRDEYLTARRVGRGTRLRKADRDGVWLVFARYRELLNGDGLVEWEDLIRETRLFIEKQGIGLPYRAVLADEVQDFTAGELRLLRAMAPDAPNSLFLVGDGHQRIYGQPVAMRQCGIEIRGRSRRLKLNYRTTQQIRARAVRILEGRDIDDLDGGLDTLGGYYSVREGPTPRVDHFASEAEEAAAVRTTLNAWIEAGVPPASICLAARTHALLKDRYGPLLRGAGIAYAEVEQDPHAEAQRPGVRLATMHRMKGLEFSRVLLAGVHAGVVPLSASGHADTVGAAKHELRERCLLYVACTRARDELVVTGFGEASHFLG